MSIVRNFFLLVNALGYIGEILMFTYIEFVIYQTNPMALLNPVIHLEVILIMLQAIYFWLFLAMAVFGHFSARGAQSIIDANNKERT